MEETSKVFLTVRMKWKVKDPKKLLASYKVKNWVDHIHFLYGALIYVEDVSPLMLEFKSAYNTVWLQFKLSVKLSQNDRISALKETLGDPLPSTSQPFPATTSMWDGCLPTVCSLHVLLCCSRKYCRRQVRVALLYGRKLESCLVFLSKELANLDTFFVHGSIYALPQPPPYEDMRAWARTDAEFNLTRTFKIPHRADMCL